MDPVTGVLIQYGAVGAVALLALAAVRVMYARLSSSVDREAARADRLEAELLKLNEAVRNDYISAISSANRSVADALAAVRRS
jgi:hypothetical protein